MRGIHQGLSPCYKYPSHPSMYYARAHFMAPLPLYIPLAVYTESDCNHKKQMCMILKHLTSFMRL